MEDNKFELIDEELKKVSGGFRPEDLEYLTEEEKRRWEELSTRAYQLHQGLPNTQHLKRCKPITLSFWIRSTD